MPLKYDTSYTVEFYKTWQHPMGPIFNIGDKAGLSKEHAESVEARGVGKIIRRPEKAVVEVPVEETEEVPVEETEEVPVEETEEAPMEETVNKEVKAPAKNKQVRSSKTK